MSDMSDISANISARRLQPDRFFSGPPSLAQAGPFAVVSPHFDDGVFSCGNLLAHHPGSLLLTVFGGVPRNDSVQTEWDLRSGFHSARMAQRVRRSEDRAAAARLAVQAKWLPFVDSQYASPPSEKELREAIAHAIGSANGGLAVIPLGLFHLDHELVSRCCMAMLKEAAWVRCIAYEDALYRTKAGLVQRRLAGLLREEGIVATPLPVLSPFDERKQQAVECYGSQLRAFGPKGYDDLRAQERYWLLERDTGNRG